MGTNLRNAKGRGQLNTSKKEIEGEDDRQFPSLRRKSSDGIQDQVGILSKVCFLPISNALKTEKTSSGLENDFRLALFDNIGARSIPGKQMRKHVVSKNTSKNI